MVGSREARLIYRQGRRRRRDARRVKEAPKARCARQGQKRRRRDARAGSEAPKGVHEAGSEARLGRGRTATTRERT